MKTKVKYLNNISPQQKKIIFKNIPLIISAAASQRVYDPIKKEWHVWYLIGQSFYFAGEWIGGEKEDHLVFEKEGEILQGRAVLSRIQFFNITNTS